MSGPVKQFLEYNVNTNNDTGVDTPASVQPYVLTEPVFPNVLNRPIESLRQRSEAIRTAFGDSAFLRDADRGLLLAGPGKISWTGSTTQGGTGIVELSDVLWLLPMLTPGAAQTPPLPPVFSTYGKLALKRADGSDALLVTSRRRSYSGGDRISVTVTPGATFACTLEGAAYQRTIQIIATPSTTLGATISALIALAPSVPDNTQLVDAALMGGALSTDLLLTTQLQRYIAGNYDGEGHALMPANLAAFFASNPGSALAEGDTLCAEFAMLSDTGSTGGRRQALPENSNTALPAGSFFNSRVNPDKLVNALPICKVVAGALVFATGVEIAPGATSVALAASNIDLRILRNASFENGKLADASQFAITGWVNQNDSTYTPVNAAFRLGTTTVRVGSRSLEYNKTATTASNGKLVQYQMLPVSPGQAVIIDGWVRQLIAPTAGSYQITLTWGDLNGVTLVSASAMSFQTLTATDSSFRRITNSLTVPGGARFLKAVAIEAVGITSVTTGVALVVDSLQVAVPIQDNSVAGIDGYAWQPANLSHLMLEAFTNAQEGNPAALARFTQETIRAAAPLLSSAAEGNVVLERKDQLLDASNLPPALAVLGRLHQLGAGLLTSAAHARKARISTPYSTSLDVTLVWEALPQAGTGTGMRIYVSLSGIFLLTLNAFFDGAAWNKDVAGTEATLFQLSCGMLTQYGRVSDVAWTTWTAFNKTSVPQTVTQGNPKHDPLLEVFDSAGNRRVVVDHNGLPGQGQTVYQQNWIDPAAAWSPNVLLLGAHSVGPGVFNLNPGALLVVSGTGDAAYNASPPLFVAPLLNEQIKVLEWASITDDLAGTPTLSFELGFKADQNIPSATHYVKVSKTSASANWQFMTRGIGAFTADTGVAATGLQRFRIEWYGVGMPGAGRALLFIDGVLVSESPSALALPAAGALPISYILKYDAGATGKEVRVGPITYLSRFFLADPAI